MKTWLVVDVNYLARRSFYGARGKLSYKEVRTGVIYGIFRDLISLQDEFRTTNVVLCFDAGRGIRKEIYPGYKAKRHAKKDEEKDPAQERAEHEYQTQVYKLRTDYLSRIGYANVFFKEGFESDDIIASVVYNLPEGDEAVIVSEDRDLYQLLSGRCRMYAPNKHRTVTLQAVKAEWGIDAPLWWRVLTLAGCDTDEVPGVHGVAKKTAIKYLTGQLKKTSAKYLSIRNFIENDRAAFKRNIKLVKLPLKGTPVFELRADKMSEKGWDEVVTSMGMKSLRGAMPKPSAARARKNLFGK